MFVNFALGKVYTITPVSGGEAGDVYVGSTTKALLSQRMDKHRADYKGWKNGKRGKVTSFDLFDKYGVDNCQITLIEQVNATCKGELIARERFYIESLGCVNKFVAGRTAKEWAEINREHISKQKADFYQANRERILKHQTEYAKENRERISKYHAEYYHANREQHAMKMKENYQANKGRYALYAKEYAKENKERKSKYQAEYKNANRDKINLQRRERRAKKKLQQLEDISNP
jgi:hypothetical protein